MKVLNIILAFLLLTPILSDEVSYKVWTVTYFAGSYIFTPVAKNGTKYDISVRDENQNLKTAVFVRFYFQKTDQAVQSKDFLYIQNDDPGILERAIRNNINQKSSKDNDWDQEKLKYVLQIDGGSVLSSSKVVYPDDVETIEEEARMDPFNGVFDLVVQFYYSTSASNVPGRANIKVFMQETNFEGFVKGKENDGTMITANNDLKDNLAKQLIINKFRQGVNLQNNSQMNDNPNDQLDKDDGYLLSTGDAKPKDKSKSQNSGSMMSKLSSAADTMKKTLSKGSNDKDDDSKEYQQIPSKPQRLKIIL